MKAKGRKKLITWGVIALAVIVLLLVIMLILTGGTMNFDALRRGLHYMGQEKSEDGMTREINFVNHSGSCVEEYGEGLIIASRTGVEVLDENGGEVLLASVSMATPKVAVRGERAFAYDVGGTAFVVIDDSRIVMEEETGNEIVSATMNDAGYIAIVTLQSNYKASVFVYNNENDQVLQQNISSGYVSDAYVTEDCAGVAVAAMSYESGSFCSKIIVYPIGDGETKQFAIKDEMVMEVHCFNSGNVCAITEKAAYFISKELNACQEYSFGSSYIKDFTFGSENKCVLLLKEYESGNNGHIVVLDSDGNVKGESQVDSEVLCISASGKYVAALYYDSLDIYMDDMDLYAQTGDTDSAIELIMREDGSVLLISYGTAKIYVP